MGKQDDNERAKRRQHVGACRSGLPLRVQKITLQHPPKKYLNNVSPANILHRAINTVVPPPEVTAGGKPVQCRQPAGI